jgi:acetyl esterase
MGGAPEWMRVLLGEAVFRQPLPQQPQQIPAWRQWLDFSAVNSPLPQGVQCEAIQLPGPAGPLDAELYRPAGAGPWPLLLFLHGGGWCVGSAASVRRLAMQLAAAGRLVVNLDYRLAPEAPWPAAVEDVLAAAWWCAAHGAELGGDGGPLLIAGDSAGANLAAATIVAATDADAVAQSSEPVPLPQGPAPRFAGALLLYGVFDFPLLMQQPGRYQGSIEVRYNLAYLGNLFLARHWHPLVSPICAPHPQRFPPTYLACGTHDDLLGQTLAMTAHLARAGVPVQLSCVAGVDHGFLQLDRLYPQAAAELARIQTWLAAVGGA